MKVLGLVGILLVSVACNNAAPTATTYKEKLGAPAAVTGDNNATPAGDPAKGQTALASCTGCHADGGIAHVLVAADAKSIGEGKAGNNAVHKSVPAAATAAFQNNKDDMAAFLAGGSTGGTPAAVAGDPAKGEALFTSACAACHAAGSPLELDSQVSLEGQDAATATHHSEVVRKAITDNKADLAAALKARQ